MKPMIYTCQQCAAQHRREGHAVRGSIQPGQLKWCAHCKDSTFHFAALAGIKPQEELADLKKRK